MTTREVLRPGQRRLQHWAVYALITFAAAGSTAFEMFESKADLATDLPVLQSSLMWQPTSHYVYFPGIPAVLDQNQPDGLFRIEQYFTTQVTGADFVPKVRGPWVQTSENELRAKASTDGPIWENPYIKLNQTVCSDMTNGTIQCITNFYIDPKLPTGTVGVSLSLLRNGIEEAHPNSVFWIIKPDHDKVVEVESRGSKFIESYINEGGAVVVPGFNFLGTRPLAGPSDPVVQISIGGNLSLGSGFIAKNAEYLAPIFTEGTLQKVIAEEIGGDSTFVVTAAHLFPIAYAAHEQDEVVKFRSNMHSAKPNPAYVYDLTVRGQLIKSAAVLVLRNIESDVAMLKIRAEVIPEFLRIFGVADKSELPGLTISDDFGPDERLRVLGYPASQATLVKRTGALQLADFPTDDTSNFGNVGKFKLNAISGETTILAEAGMSGGPILNSKGHVVGMATERPNDTNSLIAIDFTTVGFLQRTSQADRLDCSVRFNPFDRILTLINQRATCDYGRFGSAQPFAQLPKTWAFQEVMGFADSGFVEATGARSGHVTVGGHAIINGHAIIGGHAIIKGDSVVVHRANLDEVNRRLAPFGFKMNPNSFRPMMPMGVRILQAPSEFWMGRGEDVPGSLISGTKRAPNQHSFKPIYSIREFVIWLHQNQRQEALDEMIQRRP